MEKHERKGSGLLDRIGGLPLSAGPLRAGAEAIFLAAVLVVGLFFSFPGEQPNAAFPHALVVGPLSAMVLAGRMRLWSGGWRGNTLREAAAGGIVVALVTVAVVILLAVTLQAADAPGGSGSALAPTVSFWAPFLFFWNAGAFAFFRVVAYLWPRWVSLRRSRLRWEMTHTTLVVVASVSSVLIVAFVLVSLATGLWGGIVTLPRQLASALPALGILIFLTVVALAFVLPPAALVSYFAARRTAERLESLSHGTGGLRQGDFAIRVRVDGEDEIAELQKDFNAMAADLQRAVRELRSERDHVQRLLSTQRELVASVSHELRTPVATMRGYLESALEERQTPIPKSLRSDLEVTEREAVRLQRLIDDLFVLSRTEAGRLPLEIGPTDVAALLERCAEAVSENAWRSRRVEVIYDTGADTGADAEANLPRVLADEGRLEQAVRNLLANAIRHTPPGGIVALAATADPEAVAVEVKDTGEGISPDDIDHLFERFYRSEAARGDDHSGAGLGLALVKELTEAMGGTVGAESEPGSGSRFTLSLPRA